MNFFGGLDILSTSVPPLEMLCYFRGYKGCIKHLNVLLEMVINNMQHTVASLELRRFHLLLLPSSQKPFNRRGRDACKVVWVPTEGIMHKREYPPGMAEGPLALTGTTGVGATRLDRANKGRDGPILNWIHKGYFNNYPTLNLGGGSVVTVIRPPAACIMRARLKSGAS